MPKGTLVFDIETHERKKLYSMRPEEFVRLIGYRWLGGEIVLTTDLEEIREQIRQARCVIGHNLHDFDLRAVFGYKSNEPLKLAQEGRVYDTWTHAILVNPAPPYYINRHGKGAKADSPSQMRAWFSLDEQAYQLGVSGKTADLKVLAKEFGNPELKPKDRIIDGFGKIPVDDERFREYLIGDVMASEAVAKELLKKGKLDAYALREQEIAARAAVISSNGFRVDVPAAQARVDQLAARREVIMSGLVQKYDFPTEGKAPWATNEGKEAIFAALKDAGVTVKTRPKWPRTNTGNLSLGGDALKAITEGTDAEELGQALAELKGQRSLSQLALDSVYPDGFAHPEITMLQRSGRWSTTDPGLTVWTSRGENAVEKAYFLPDTDDEVLLAFDYSNADARIVAAFSGDKKFAERFEEGADGHLINAWAAWGKDVVGTDKDDPVTAKYRFKAKALGHGWNYGGQAKTLSQQAGLPLEVAKQFCDGLAKQFTRLISWQNKIRADAQKGWVKNKWGRKMWVEKGREFTQAPALIGQSGTREVMCDALLRMPYYILRRVKAQIHDELIFSVPKENWEEWRDEIIEIMQDVVDGGKGGQVIEFPVSAGEPGRNWHEATH